MADDASPLDIDPFRRRCSTASPPRLANGDTARPRWPTSSGMRARQNARSTTGSSAKSNAFWSCCAPTANGSVRRSGRRSTRGGLASPDPSGGRRLRRQHRISAAIALSWIRELPSLGAAARPVQRRGLELLTNLLVDLSGSLGFRRAGLPPLTPPLAVILLGGLRELTALAVEDGHDIRQIVEPAVDASVALLGPRQ
ncbi:tetR family transcriptional regulator [Mycobacterium xenopi 4042]|uniref:TetR family transcriptional regulator n=1 Tax=Mycobacterium xenopi 4042 TaxID=1299334 RepID=X7YVB7_MYCXE|nr:tetR family transcriptional regulator [Mycobacterium xenopi 4042]